MSTNCEDPNSALFNTHKVEEETLAKYVCGNCGFVYDPAEGDSFKGIESGTKFKDLPDDWVCPSFGAEKWRFSPED
jgi:rubredoxin